MELKSSKIEKDYGKRKVVKGVDIHVKSGEICGLLGPNGAGKTTSFYMLVGFIKPTGGKVFMDGKDVSHLPMYERARHGLGYLAQEPTIFRGLTVEENLLSVFERIEEDEKKRNKKVADLLEEFGLTKLAKQQAWTLSGGEKRRMEIARCMIMDPKIILLDEPFVGIDPITVADLKKMIIKLKKKGIGILITDHNVRETLPIVERAYLIYDGQILIEGTPDKLLKDKNAKEFYLGEDFKI
ncbi:MAG: LPS export ABC transporter ATP-binding protein [Elusimicrobiaceae bacterium]|jgi:lipopolysaccharide export system ATP-binding protein|nr:LPS export ABC transporter ATP-binding protein [Elusimicrobiaceae bacterium]MBT4008504.1 LPS export ABC transporter ATP-binding protein [Elusimicrobiaceae bacterium]MBT4403392.1 LPS export ABC transporter ATP-binding protein [Elusimicrobiaceae bacterium]MBT4440233.1 LPS export ABC transporter ATP-binding protein [Elusimicrobiaceae bacterium]MBT5987657.1 LPS export ABC transporter ATP-binding protein [Elusimicrobiaceae bacterium]